MTRAVRTALVACGTVALILGIVGVFLPVLPSTPFLLLAAACYARSSKRLRDWLLGHPVFGGYIRDYRDRQGMGLRAKVLSITVLWVGIGISILAVEPLWLELLLAGIAVIVMAHILKLRTLRPEVHPPEGR